MIETNNSTDTLGFRSVADLNKENERKELGQEDFLELMTTQLQNQDPFKPMENGDFLAQIAQFSTVDGIQGLETAFGEFSQSMVSNQALQASNIVGRNVLAPTGLAALEEGGAIKGVAELPAGSGQVTVTITDTAGQTVRRLSLGQQPAGPVEFQWDGLKDDGQYAAPGTYFVTSSALYSEGDTALDTALASKVNGVTLSKGGGLLLDLKGVGQLDFGEVRQIL